MKKIIMLLMLLFSLVSTKAQNGYVPPLQINWNDTSAFISKQTDFYIGYHWMGSTPKTVSTLLHANHFFEQWGLPGARPLLNNIPNDGKIKTLVWSQIGGGGEAGINEYIMSMGVDPTAPVRSLPPWSVVQQGTLPRTGDTTGAYFGFSQRDSVYGSVPSSGGNFDRYVLTKSGVPADTGVLVLSKPITQTWFRYTGTNFDDSIRRSASHNQYIPAAGYNGSQFYLSLNLRRTDIADTSINVLS